MHTFWEWLLWGSLGVVLYTYLLYPIVLVLSSSILQTGRDTRFLWQRCNRRPGKPDAWPPVTVIIAAYNEQSCIVERIHNLMALDYPSDRLTIRVGSDGSTDETNALLSNLDIPNLRLHLFERNRGKSSVLNDLVAESEDDILVMTDANTQFEADALKTLVRHFNDAGVGAVCGELHLWDAESGDNQDGLYWRYEQILKFHESRMGALLGANGAIYAIRRSLYIDLPVNTIIDDFRLVMQVAKAGYRLVYDPEARAQEKVAPSVVDEAQRRVRIGMGNYQALFTMPWALSPRYGWRWFSYLSHKVCRWFVPHCLVVAALANTFLIASPGYLLLWLLQLGVYGLVWQGWNRQKQGKRLGGLQRLLLFFVLMNLALLKGFLRYMSGDVQGHWKRTARE
ncbi:1,2-diacylglycerol 3-glucosyltransferase [Saliniradius amylolyticus]|uniref:1,2-diacylglycerol 3-glucosyltransferase n=1 Tax=Saliniradius amylolyticus TaxID=2183582 RepID=A0A2S2E2B3_9ALTE|nr:glycosyltransferase family 2 protein [Saliniradius amylolyticus]AWL11662.1 1,2-diacylglycerol 3-glucosyltransferase [Saliniradius amylolyticus]